MAKEKTINVRLGGILVGILLAAILAILWGYNRKVDNISSALYESNQKVKYYNTVVDELNETVAETKLWVWSKEQALVLSESQIERLRKQNIDHVNAIGRLELTVSALQDSLTLYREVINATDTIIKEIPVEVIDDRNMIELPVSFGEENEYLTQWAIIDSTGLGSLGFKMQPFSLDITLGSRGVFRKDYIVTAATSNPYFTVDQNNFQVVGTSKIKPAVYGVAAGIVGGAVATYFIMR